ncbi:MAG TPA: FAD-dependent oxidoreductase [Steroidobacter sp.]|nr:FAD-dependent oxidoreductase [Steroidobacter sp.]
MHVVVVGAGQAAAQAIETLRRRNFTGPITLIGDEPILPYQRPPLSKKLLSGELERDRLLIRHARYYEEHGITQLLGRRVVSIDCSARTVRCDDDTLVSYDALLLATGSRPRRIAVPGGDLAGVCYLRTESDALALRDELKPGRRLVVVGGGYIGLEVAATSRERGVEVTVLEMADRVMNRVTCSKLSAFLAQEHERHGVRIHCQARVNAILADAQSRSVRAVRCDDGTEHPADLVLIGVGVEPVDELAKAAGLDCSNGIVVDASCRTSDPYIFSAGDCTNHPSLRYGGRVRLESVDNAFEQGTTAALSILGEHAQHSKTPWFWSDQYDLKLVIVGLCSGHDAVVVRGDPHSRAFSLCYLRDGELIAIDTVNSPKDQMAARKLIAARARPDPNKLADVTTPLKDSVTL